MSGTGTAQTRANTSVPAERPSERNPISRPERSTHPLAVERRNGRNGAELLDRLTDAINRCCAARGDDERNRLALLTECQGLPEADQTDLAEHFEEEAARWEAATLGKALGSPWGCHRGVGAIASASQ